MAACRLFPSCYNVSGVTSVNEVDNMAREWTSRPPGTKAVRVDVPEPVHAKLRILAAEAGLPMSGFVRKLAEDAVRARYPEVFGRSDNAPARKRVKRINGRHK
jgi:hypothetical protein